MPNDWTRFQSGEVFNRTVSTANSIYSYTHLATFCNARLSQANHIFRRLNIMSNFEDYVFINHVRFDLNIFQTTGNPPEGFLFLCPQEDFQTGPSSFCCPACPAYWSLDPSGIDRLSSEVAAQLVFPPFELTVTVHSSSWDASVYEGLRQFHEAKGFDPYSQDVALLLDYLFYRLSSERDALPWDYVDSDDKDFDADIDSDCDSAHPEDYESEYLPISAGNDSADLDVETESLHFEEDVHDTAGENRGSEPTEISNYANHNASQSTLEEDMVAEEIFVPSPIFRIVLYIQLIAISFLAFSWVYDQIW
ncbi:hypothetical protein MSAN_02135700 [Mycena sanguinolenta]|uniref:Uncharacterized protein n=1 Tax=Mycena sanguinolenta TaxID=230812 RepID=A0A8H6XFS0_9AGAR|nr:hypothetical protein MSAN_02135700 [Mycena sanguinolenta]